MPRTITPRHAGRALYSARWAGAAMALSKLSGDEQGIILGQLCNSLEPRLAVYFSSASSELRALLTPALRQQLLRRRPQLMAGTAQGHGEARIEHVTHLFEDVLKQLVW